jgi:hypothetical protein
MSNTTRKRRTKMTLAEIAREVHENPNLIGKRFTFRVSKVAELYCFNENYILTEEDSNTYPAIHAYDLYKDTWHWL